jgi:hypothetical protein
MGENQKGQKQQGTQDMDGDQKKPDIDMGRQDDLGKKSTDSGIPADQSGKDLPTDVDRKGGQNQSQTDRGHIKE